MKVKDLIEALEKLDPEIEVWKSAPVGSFETMDIDQIDDEKDIKNDR